ncbi:DNA cytosine methyltransferase [Streptomyces sp. bgisy153]|uniref:DNA cytosine methyltransferase n=1 Tax=Streptomyces sp. bgisy153 TaxID=3413793 RepID=UPI003D72142D
MASTVAAEPIAEPIRVTALGTAADGTVHLLADHADTTARCGFADWHSYVMCVDWLEEPMCPVCVADLAVEVGVEIPKDVLDELDEIAAPWPGRWLLRPREGDLERVVGIFAGPGGWDAALDVIGALYDAVGVDFSGDACATAERAGHRRIVADVTRLDPGHPALRWTAGIIISPPCPSWSIAGKRAGLTAESLKILADMFTAVSEAARSLWADDAGGGQEERATPSETTWSEIRAMADAMPDKRAGLMAEVLIWPLALQLQGAPISWLAMEQSDNLPQEVREGIETELAVAGRSQQQWVELDAAAYGVATHRRRVFLMATRHGRIPGSVRSARPIAEQTFAAAFGWKPGERVNTRGVRGLNANGRPKGGNVFSADRVGWCLTGKARGWYRESDGYRLTLDEGGQAVGFLPSHPWQGSRSSAFQQIGDAVSPPVGAAVMGALIGQRWEDGVARYLGCVYRGSPPTPARRADDVGPVASWALAA